MILQRTEQGIKFSVDEVTPAAEALPMDSLGRTFESRAGRPVVVMPERDRQVVAEPVRDRRSYRPLHGLIEAIHFAFSQHRPLILSPDSIWLVIAQGFGHHVNENAELLRSQMVAHAGRRSLTVELESMNYRDAIADLSAQVRELSNPVLHETLVCDFSTTTATIRTASEVVLLDTYQRYFEYRINFICGIPEITLEGTRDDWQRIRARVEVLETYELGWWVIRLRPILDELVRTADGQPCREFWRAIYKPARAYGTETATGWIADLFPYLGDPPNRVRNPVFATPRVEWSVPVKAGIAPVRFPSGLSQVPVQSRFPDGSNRKNDLLAGFFAVGQSQPDKALFPVIGWSIVESDPDEANWDALAQRFPTQPKAPGAKAFDLARPVELAYFAGRYASMDLRLAKGKWRIVPSFHLKDEDGELWTCFAYDCEAIESSEPRQPCRVLALQPPSRRFSKLFEAATAAKAPVARVKGNPPHYEQGIYICDLHPDYDPRQPPQEPPMIGISKFPKTANAVTAPEAAKTEAEITGVRRLEGDLFTFLFGLIEREGKVDRNLEDPPSTGHDLAPLPKPPAESPDLKTWAGRIRSYFAGLMR
jgi:Domain of unknown function (DUF4419)